MARGKSINVKIPTAKVIKALQDALDKMTKEFEADEKASKAHEKAMKEYNAQVAEICMKHFSKAENIRINERNWQNNINIDFDIPASSVKLPKKPEFSRSGNPYQYEENKKELENAIRLLKLTDEEVVSTSTYNAVARFI